MSKAGFITVGLQDLGGGQNDFARPNQVADNQATYLRNARTDGLSTKNRDGFTIFANEITTTGDVNGMASYLPFATANDKLVMAVDDDLYYATPASTTWTQFTDADGLITSDTDMNFANFGDFLICMNGVDEVGVVGITDTVTYEEPASATVKLGFGTVFTDQLFAAGVTSQPNNLYYGKQATSAAPENIYDIGGTSGGAGVKRFSHKVETIVASKQALYVFTAKETFITRKSTEDWDFSTPSAPVPLFNTVSGFGCAGKNAAVAVGDQVYYLTPENEIRVINYTSGGNLETPAISDVIKNTMLTLDEDQSACKAIYYPIQRLVKFFVKTKDSAFNDLHLIYDLSLGAKGKSKRQWLIDNGKPFSDAVYHKGIVYTGSDLEGKAFTDENGDYADDGNLNIIYERNSKEFDFQNPTARKRFRELRFKGVINDNTSITVTVAVDGADVKEVIIDNNDITVVASGALGDEEVGDFQIGGDDQSADSELYDFVKIIKFRSTGRKIQFKFNNDGQGQKFRVDYGEAELKPLDKLQHKVSNIN